MSEPTKSEVKSMVQQPSGIVEINSQQKKIDDVYRQQGHIINSDPDKKLKPKNHLEEYNAFIVEQAKIRRLKIELKPSYPLPKNAKTGQDYTTDDIKFTQFKQVGTGGAWVLELQMNDSSEFQVQL